MRIMTDTNILLSALVFGSNKLALLLERITEEHTLVLCSHIIEEFRQVVLRKSPQYAQAVDSFFVKLPFEMVYTPEWQEGMPQIRDEHDKPILAAALWADVDVLITGDKGFYAIDIERPEILSPTAFLEKY